MTQVNAFQVRRYGTLSAGIRLCVHDVGEQPSCKPRSNEGSTKTAAGYVPVLRPSSTWYGSQMTDRRSRLGIKLPLTVEIAEEEFLIEGLSWVPPPDPIDGSLETK